MSAKLSERQAAILHAFVSWTEPGDPEVRDRDREALYSSDDLYERLHQLPLPTPDLLLATYQHIESLCDNTSGYANCISQFSEDPSYQFSAGFILYYMVEDPSPHNWLGGLDAEISFFLEGFSGNSDGDVSDELGNILKPLEDETVALGIASKFFELAQSGPRNTSGQSFCEVLEEAGLMPKA